MMMISASLILIVVLEAVRFAPVSTITSSFPRDFRRHAAAPPTDWEPGLREAAHQAFLRERYSIPNLREVLLQAPIVGQANVASPFGDIAILARGQIFSSPAGFKFVQDPYQNDCVDCHRRSLCTDTECDFYQARGSERLEALWTVKRIRHRDPDYGHRYELEYTISPIRAESRVAYVTGNGSFDYSLPGHVFIVKTNAAQPGDNYKWYKKASPNHFATTQSSRFNRVKADRPPPPSRFYLPNKNHYHESSAGGSTTPADEDEIELFKNLVQSLSQQTSSSPFRPTKFPHRFGPPNRYHPTTVGTNFLKPTQNTVPYSPTVPYHDSKFSSTRFPTHNTGYVRFPPPKTTKTTYFVPQEEIPSKPLHTTTKTTYFFPQEEIPARPVHTTTPKTTYFIPGEEIPIRVTNPHHTYAPTTDKHAYKPTKASPVTYHTTITKTTSNRPVVHYTTDIYTTIPKTPSGFYATTPYFTTNKAATTLVAAHQITTTPYSKQTTYFTPSFTKDVFQRPTTIFSTQTTKIPSTTLMRPETTLTTYPTQTTYDRETTRPAKTTSSAFYGKETSAPITKLTEATFAEGPTTVYYTNPTLSTPPNFNKESTISDAKESKFTPSDFYTTSTNYYTKDTAPPTNVYTKDTEPPTNVYTKDSAPPTNVYTKNTEPPTNAYTKYTAPTTDFYTKEQSVGPTTAVYYSKETTPNSSWKPTDFTYYTKETDFATRPGVSDKETTVEKNTQQTTQIYNPTYTFETGKPVPTFYIDETHPGYPKTTPTTPFTDSYKIQTVQTPPPTKPQFKPSAEHVHYSEPYPTYESTSPATALTSPTTLKLPFVTNDRYFPESAPHYVTIPVTPAKANTPFLEDKDEDIDIFPEDKNQLPRPPPPTSTPSSIKQDVTTEDFLISDGNYTPRINKPLDSLELFPTTIPLSTTSTTTEKPKINTLHIEEIFNVNTTKPTPEDSLQSFEKLFAPVPTQPLTTQPTKKFTNEFEDLFDTKRKRSRPRSTTGPTSTSTQPTVKIIYSDFYVASTAQATTNLEGFTTSPPIAQTLPATSQSLATSISYEVHNRTQQHQVKYRRAKVTKVNNVSDDDDFVVYKAEPQKETPEDVNKSFDDLALSLVNHARSIDYLQKSKATGAPKYRRKTVNRTRRLRKKTET